MHSSRPRKVLGPCPSEIASLSGFFLNSGEGHDKIALFCVVAAWRIAHSPALFPASPERRPPTGVRSGAVADSEILIELVAGLL
jgi:hypothetical protein